MSEVGPVEYMVVGFPRNNFNGAIASSLSELVRSGLIRIIDLAFVAKGPDGDIEAMELEDMDSETGRAFQALETKVGELVSDADLAEIGDRLAPDTSAAVLVWEDLWAEKLASALKNAGGMLLRLERVPHEIVQEALAYANAANGEKKAMHGAASEP